MANVGMRIESMRGYRRMTQEELGGMVGVTKATVSNWEKGRRVPRADDIVRLCRALECTSDYLLGMVERPDDHVRW